MCASQISDLVCVQRILQLQRVLFLSIEYCIEDFQEENANDDDDDDDYDDHDDNDNDDDNDDHDDNDDDNDDHDDNDDDDDGDDDHDDDDNDDDDKFTTPYLTLLHYTSSQLSSPCLILP